jgi:hypothetical protein
MKIPPFLRLCFLVLLLCSIAWTPVRVVPSSIQPLRNVDDPLNTRKLVYASYLGGSLVDAILDLDEDASGNIYMTGFTNSKDLPTTSSAFQRNARGNEDGFVAKIGPNGHLIYLTYLGGRGYDTPERIVADSHGSAVIVGVTNSPDFPLRNALRTRFQHQEGFVTKLSPQGDRLIFSTFWGGSDGDGVLGVTLDTQEDIYVTGYTVSPDFPLRNPVQAKLVSLSSLNPKTDAFVTKFSPDGSEILYSTYFGGLYTEYGYSIKVDNEHNMYFAGITYSRDFPVRNALFPVLRGNDDAFFTKLDATGQNIIYSSYLGGSRGEKAVDLSLDTRSALYITGETSSRDFPLKQPFQRKLGGGDDAFVTKIAPDGRHLVYSSYLGSKSGEQASRVSSDAGGNAYVCGSSSSTDFPSQYPPVGTHGFFVRLPPLGSRMTSIMPVPRCFGMHITSSQQFSLAFTPTDRNLETTRAFQPDFGGGAVDGYVMRFVPN